MRSPSALLSPLLVLLVASSLSSQHALAQDDVRGASAAGDELGSQAASGGGGGQPRTIYSQRHLSPHRMMHFGKRPLNLAPPSLLSPQVFDLYRPAGQPAGRLAAANRYPYLLTIELEHGRTLQALPEDFPSRPEVEHGFNPNSAAYSVDLAALIADAQMQQRQQQQLHKLQFQQQQQQQQQQQHQQQHQRLDGQKFLRLMSEAAALDAGAASAAGELGASAPGELPQSSQDESAQQADAQQQPPISLTTRSMQQGRNTLSIPKAYISSLLYGRQGSSSMPSFVSFNKKAEPKDNFFMHFG